MPVADYRKELPRQALLLVEAADSSLRQDREVKAPIYARSNVRDYWILDLEAQAIEVYRDPTESGYRTVVRYGREEMVSLLAFPDISIRVSDIIR